MNREIKFRAFDDGVMIKSDAYQDERNCSDYDYLRFFFEKIRTDAIVMQFTGQTDVNGKEIYEGDILEAYNRKGGRSPKNVKVYWNEYSLSFSINTIEKDGGQSLGMPLNNPFLKVGKIIGNIFENPELLKP